MGQCSSWQSFTIPNLPNGTTLSRIWTGKPGEVYVWGRTSQPGTDVPESALYKTSDAGNTWNVILTIPDSDARGVFGVSATEIFAAAFRCPSGYAAGCGTGVGLQMYRSLDGGANWALQALPGPPLDGAGSIAGKPSDVFISVCPWGVDCCYSGGQFMRFDGANWSVQFTDTDPGYIAAFYPSPTLAYIQPNQIFAPTCWGHWLYTGTWSFVSSGFDFCDVGPAWGMRDAQGNLTLYTTGTNNFANGAKIWKFTEDSPGSLSGSWGGKYGYVFSDGDGYLCGSGDGIWGSAPNDVWATGVFNAGGPCAASPAGEGRVYHFDGTSWSRMTTPFDPLPQIFGISGTGADDVWVSTASGQVLHYGAHCTLSLRLSYFPNTLSIGYTLGTSQAGSWAGYIVTAGGVKRLWKRSMAGAINPPFSGTISVPNFLPAGNVGVVSTDSTNAGLACWDFEVVNTGRAGPTIEELRRIAEMNGLPLP